MITLGLILGDSVGGLNFGLSPVHLAYKPYFFSQRTVFFSHNKSANSAFSHGLSAKRTGHVHRQIGGHTHTIAPITTWQRTHYSENLHMPSRLQRKHKTYNLQPTGLSIRWLLVHFGKENLLLDQDNKKEAHTDILELVLPLVLFGIAPNSCGSLL